MDLSMNERAIFPWRRCSKEKKQIKGNLIFPVRLRSIFWLTSAQTVQVKPAISERLFTYDYRNEKEWISAGNGRPDTLDAVDATLKAAYDNQNSDEFRKKMLKVYAMNTIR